MNSPLAGNGTVRVDSPPSPADYIEDQIELNRELVPSPMSTSLITVVGDAMRGVGLTDGDLVFMTGPSSTAQGVAWWLSMKAS